MADRKKSIPNWFDPLGIRGSILDPLAPFSEAAKMVTPGAQPFTWMMTTAARRLQGRRVSVKTATSIEARVARIVEVVPATEIPVPVLSESIGLWQRAEFSVDQVTVGGKPIDRVDVVATDIRIKDSTARQMKISRVNLLATLTTDSLDVWLEDLGVNENFDFDSGNISVRLVAGVSWLAVVAKPKLRPRGVEARAVALKVGPVSIPVPNWLSKTRSVDLQHLPMGFELKDMQVTADRQLVVTLEGTGIDFPINLPRLMAEIGVDGTMSVVNILRQ